MLLSLSYQSPQFRHPGESRGPAFHWGAAQSGVPVFAGMTAVLEHACTEVWEHARHE